MLALLVAPSYIFITFFKVVFLVIVIAALHGLILLPVLLSLFGPGSCGSSHEEKELSNDKMGDRIIPYAFVLTPDALDPKRKGKSLEIY